MEKLNSLGVTMLNRKLILCLMLAIILVGTVSAWDLGIDNRMDVSQDNKTITYVDTAIFGEDTELMKIELKTDLNQGVGVGYVKVFEYEITNTYEDIDKMLGSMNFYNVRNGMKPVEVEVDFKYSEIVNNNGTNRVCNVDNKTLEETCEDIPYSYDSIVYHDYTQKTMIKGEKITISGWVTTEEGDKIEWEQYFYDDKLFIDKEIWATWTAALNVDILSYWKFDEEDTTGSGNILDQLKVHNGTNSGGDNVSGKLVYAYDFVAASNDYIDFGDVDPLNDASGGAISFWMNWDGGNSQTVLSKWGTGDRIGFFMDAGGSLQAWVGDSSTGGWHDLIASPSTDTWYHVVMNHKSADNNNTFYIDGTLVYSEVYDYGDESFDFVVGRFSAGTGDYDGTVDEVGVWNRELTTAEITQLYNGGTGISYTNNFDVAPSIDVNAPVDELNSTTTDITLNCTATDNSYIENVTFYVDDAIVSTNTSHMNNTAYTYTHTFPQGTTAWICGACDNATNCINSSARNVNVDTIDPYVEHISPTTLQQNNSDTMQVNFTYNVSDTNSDACWYDLGNGTNYTLTDCSETSEVIALASGLWNVTLYANDTFGNENNTGTTSFYVNAFGITNTYDNPTIEGEEQTITMHLGNLSSLSSLEGNLTYNGTLYEGTVDNQNISVTLTTPDVDANTDVNFSWAYLINNESFSTDNITQTILNFSSLEVALSCSAGLSPTMHFTFAGENNLTAHNASVDYLFRYGITNSSARTTKGNLTNVEGFYVCINSTVYNNYSLGYGEVQYEKDGFTARRFYNFIGDRISNVTQNYTLYSLNNADSTSFLMTVQDNDLSPYVNYILGLSRWYPELDQYNTVELARTDEKGQTVLKVYTEDVDYRISVYQPNGTLIYLSDPFRLVCTVSPCSYTITIDDEEGQLFERWNTLNDSLTFNSSTGIFTFIYNDPTQTTENIFLRVYKMTGTGDVLICSDNATGYTSVLYCNVSGYTGTLKAVGSRSASPETAIASRIESVFVDSLTNDMGLIITLGVMVVLVLIGVVSPILTVVLSIVGLIPAIILGIIPLQVMLIFGAIGFIVIAYMRKV